MSVGLLRGLAFAVPAVLTVVAIAIAPRTERALGACLLSFTWGLGALPLLNAAAVAIGWWDFHAEGALLLGVPMDVLLGWALLWGPVALVLGRQLPVPVVAGFLLLVDWALMPRLEPMLHLYQGWLVGELWLLGLAFAPAQLLARWTWDGTHLGGRVALHLAQFALVIGFLLPHAALVHTGASWEGLTSLEAPWPSVAAQAFALLGLPGLCAVLEFRERGGGTPVPFDGPVRVVTSGPYAYVRNPMQLSTALCFLLLGAILRSPAVAGIGAMAVVYGAGLAAWHEQAGDLDRRLGPGWRAWHGSVRPWLPRWRPAVAEPATLWVARSCGPCRAVGEWVVARAPIGLEVRAAEGAPEPLDRMRYSVGTGFHDDGIGALARALEHLNLGWAMVGWAARLPLVRPALQVVVDAIGGGPRDLE